MVNPTRVPLSWKDSERSVIPILSKGEEFEGMGGWKKRKLGGNS